MQIPGVPGARRRSSRPCNFQPSSTQYAERDDDRVWNRVQGSRSSRAADVRLADDACIVHKGVEHSRRRPVRARRAYLDNDEGNRDPPVFALLLARMRHRHRTVPTGGPTQGGGAARLGDCRGPKKRAQLIDALRAIAQSGAVRASKRRRAGSRLEPKHNSLGAAIVAQCRAGAPAGAETAAARMRFRMPAMGAGSRGAAPTRSSESGADRIWQLTW